MASVAIHQFTARQALDFLRIMRRDPWMRPTEVVHGVVIGACLKSHQLKEGGAKNMFRESTSQSTVGKDGGFNIYIHTYIYI